MLLLGVLVFVFYVFNPPPLLFSSAADASGCAASARARPMRRSSRTARPRSSGGARPRPSWPRARHATTRPRRPRRANAVRDARAPRWIRSAATGRASWCGRRPAIAAFDDVNYIIPTFILTQLPVGLVGLLILAILLAATDTIAGELNSLSTATVIDFYRRWVRPVATDAHYLTVSKVATGVVGSVRLRWSPSGRPSSVR